MSRSIHRALSLAAAVGLLALGGLVASGCGGDTRRAELDASTTTTAPSPPASTGGGRSAAANRAPVTAVPTSPAQRAYVKQVDGVCAHIDPERNKARERAGKASDVNSAVKAYDDSIKLGDQQLKKIEAIPPPPGEAHLLKANVFDVIRQQLATRRKLSAALVQNQSLGQIRRLRAHLDGLTVTLVGFARGYGFQTCGAD